MVKLIDEMVNLVSHSFKGLFYEIKLKLAPHSGSIHIQLAETVRNLAFGGENHGFC